LIIRHATVLDLSELYSMLNVMHSETVNTVSPICPETLTSAINAAIHRGIVLIGEVDGRIAGSIGGMETSDWWSKDKALADMFYFVYKEHRNSTIAVRLIKSFIEIGKNANIKVKLGHVYSGDGDRKDKFYERLGLIKAGSLYTEN